MAWEVFRRARGFRKGRGPGVMLSSRMELTFNAEAVREFGLRTGKVEFLVDRERFLLGVLWTPDGNNVASALGKSCLRVRAASVLQSLGVAPPDPGTTLFASVSREKSVIVIPVHEWEKH